MSTFKSIVFPTDLGTGITYPDIVSIEMKNMPNRIYSSRYMPFIYSIRVCCKIVLSIILGNRNRLAVHH